SRRRPSPRRRSSGGADRLPRTRAFPRPRSSWDADPQGGQLDGVEDLRVPGAAAEVACERLLDLLARRARPGGKERLGRAQEAGRAVTALGGAELGERLLEWMKAPAL